MPLDTIAGQTKPSPRWKRIQGILAALLAGFLGLLVIAYATVGDRTPWTEYLTVWPPVLWLVPGGLLAVPLMLGRRRRENMPLAGILVLYLLILVEWRPLLRIGERARPDGSIRLVTWNIGGGYRDKASLLAELTRWEPDVVLLQETPDGASTFQPADLTGYWEGWHWEDAGDCGTLSRWPLRVLESDHIGPWDDPQALALEHETSPILVVNVRAMLPSLELFPFNASAYAKLSDDNRDRTAQFPALASLIAKQSAAGSYAGAILAGDFNTDGSARSIAPIRATMRDAWPRAGRGWGGTVTNAFPVARIDHVYTNGSLRAIQAHVAKTTISDHRPLVVDIAIGSH